MTNAESKQQYEGAILEQLIKNAERLAVIETELTQLKETDIAQLKKNVEAAKWLLITIAVGVFINLLSQPVLSWLN